MDNKCFRYRVGQYMYFLQLATAFIESAITYFMQSWSLLFVVLLIVELDILYQLKLRTHGNKAYGLNYTDKNIRPDL